jgi:hypothetical protein
MSHQAQFLPEQSVVEHPLRLATKPDLQAPPLDELQDHYALKRHQFEIRKADAAFLREQLEDACYAVLENGASIENVNQVRMLETCLLQARRHLHLAQQQLELAALRLERARAAPAAIPVS